MDIYIDKENLLSLINSRSENLYSDCVKILKKQLNVFFNFPIDVLKTDDKLMAWYTSFQDGVGENNVFSFGNNFPDRPFGKIGHLIQTSYYDKLNILNFEYKKDYSNVIATNFDLDVFKSISTNFTTLFENNESISNKIWSLLLLSDYFKRGRYYNVHDLVLCNNSEKEAVIQNKAFLKHLLFIKNNESLDNYINEIDKAFFKQYKTIEDLKNETDYIKQIFIYQLTLRSINNWGWWKGKNFGIYDRNNDKGFNCFFYNKFEYQHYKQKWYGSDNNFFDHSKSTITKYLKSNNIF